MLSSTVAVIISYLLGSVSFSILIARWVKGIDIRQHGSGNAGATNTLRILGKGPAAAVFLLDIAKGVAAVFLGVWLDGGFGEWSTVLCGLAAICGHNWPVWFRFRGGKGIATTIGVMGSLAFVPALLAGLAALVVILLTRYVSLGSLVFALATPIVIAVLGRPMPLFWAAVILCAFAFVRHRTNIAKLVQGRENKLGSRRKEVPHDR